MMSATNAQGNTDNILKSILNIDFVPSMDNQILPLSLICEKTLSNDSMKPVIARDDLGRTRSHMMNKDL